MATRFENGHQKHAEDQTYIPAQQSSQETRPEDFGSINLRTMTCVKSQRPCLPAKPLVLYYAIKGARASFQASGGLSAVSYCDFCKNCPSENVESPPSSTAEGPHSILKDMSSPALSATVIIIITVIISGSAYLFFLKYICSGCCKATQVVPARRLDPSRSEEQV